MSVTREEDRQKNTCPSRGFGIAAAAISVGVGAALYYFFNKRAENPHSEGSTSSWTCESPQTFNIHHSSDDSYTTISEHETTDTSIYDASVLEDQSFNDSTSADLIVVSDSEDYSETEFSFSQISPAITDSDSDLNDFDVTTSSIGIPEDGDRSRSPLVSLDLVPRVRPKRRTTLTEEEQMAMIRQEQFRERSWTLEECSICFDVMLRNQEVTQLPCAHNFHTQCIMPWLQEKQTCPNCRKVAE